jgi:hypothetical protein
MCNGGHEETISASSCKGNGAPRTTYIENLEPWGWDSGMAEPKNPIRLYKGKAQQFRMPSCRVMAVPRDAAACQKRRLLLFTTVPTGAACFSMVFLACSML